MTRPQFKYVTRETAQAFLMEYLPAMPDKVVNWFVYCVLFDPIQPGTQARQVPADVAARFLDEYKDTMPLEVTEWLRDACAQGRDDDDDQDHIAVSLKDHPTDRPQDEA
ncbi:hypothetical protein GGF32_007623, partial [Allomyces javanicus]